MAASAKWLVVPWRHRHSHRGPRDRFSVERPQCFTHCRQNKAHQCFYSLRGSFIQWALVWKWSQAARRCCLWQKGCFFCCKRISDRICVGWLSACYQPHGFKSQCCARVTQCLFKWHFRWFKVINGLSKAGFCPQPSTFPHINNLAFKTLIQCEFTHLNIRWKKTKTWLSGTDVCSAMKVRFIHLFIF